MPPKLQRTLIRIFSCDGEDALANVGDLGDSGRRLTQGQELRRVVVDVGDADGQRGSLGLAVNDVRVAVPRHHLQAELALRLPVQLLDHRQLALHKPAGRW